MINSQLLKKQQELQMMQQQGTKFQPREELQKSLYTVVT